MLWFIFMDFTSGIINYNKLFLCYKHLWSWCFITTREETSTVHLLVSHFHHVETVLVFCKWHFLFISASIFPSWGSAFIHIWSLNVSGLSGDAYFVIYSLCFLIAVPLGLLQFSTCIFLAISLACILHISHLLHLYHSI